MKLKNKMTINAHTFNVELATEIGLNKAILLNHLYYWHQINENKKNNIKDGRVWTYNTIKEFNKIFPYLTSKQISYAFEKLNEEDYIVIGNYNKANFDQTKWYSLTDKALSLFVKCNLQNVKCKLQNGNPNLQNGNAIPDNNTDNNTNNNINIDEDFYGKIFFKIVDNYPKNKIGNRQHGLKSFKQLTKEEAKLAISNLRRYLALVSEPKYVKSLLNYIDQRCFTEEWLKAEEETKNKSKIINNNVDTKNFDTNY